MVKNLKIGREDATALLVSLAGSLDSLEGWPDSNPGKRRLLDLHTKIKNLYPEA